MPSPLSMGKIKRKIKFERKKKVSIEINPERLKYEYDYFSTLDIFFGKEIEFNLTLV